MDIVKFTFKPQSESELNALIEEIHSNAALSDSEKRQLLEEIGEWSKTDTGKPQ